MSEGNAQSDKKEEIVRFRRWIAMTTDGKWREFRGTPGMINIGQGRDLVELVDRMMAARITHFGHMHKGWKLMRAGLTPLNAEWIYSEMMASIETLLKFETYNFSPSNSWTAAKPRAAFPPYLSDEPVLDGQSEVENTNVDSILRQICGEVVTRRLMKLFREANVPVETEDNYFEGTSEQFLALGRNCNPYNNQLALESFRPYISTQDSSTQTDNTSVQANRICSGVGVSFNADGEPTITMMCNDGVSRAVTPVPRRNDIPSLMSLNCESGALPANPTNMVALVITQNANGEIASVGYVPMYPQHLLPAVPNSQVLDLTSGNQEERIPRPRRLRSAARRPQPASVSNGLTANSDSGFSSTSDPGNLSTRASTPATISPPVDTLTVKPIEIATPEAFPPISPAQISPIIEEVAPQPTGPSYASIVSKQCISPRSSTTDRVVTYAQAASSSRTVMTNNLGVGEMTFPSSSIPTSSSMENEWIQVKNKNAVKPIETPILIPKPVKEEKETLVSEVAESWDTLEVDDEREMEQERKRLKKQKQRAAKVQRQKEEKKMRSENPEEPTIDEEEEEEEEESVVPSIENQIVCDEPISKPMLAIATYYDELGRYCDDDVIREPEPREVGEDPKEILYAEAKEHNKLLFPHFVLLITPEARAALQEQLDAFRAMHERIDMAGRIIVYRIGSPNGISGAREENMIGIAKNLIDMKRCDHETDMEMARALGNVVGKLTKNFTYLDYVFTILNLQEDFIVKFKEDDPRISEYKHIEVLTQLHVKRVKKFYEELCELYHFNIVKVSRYTRN
uniref:SPK domain-containing protein n=1 Tax=Caenorhabditis tropicalis TaxID=1561998 RepID=A0A1I7T0F0_9PELO